MGLESPLVRNFSVYCPTHCWFTCSLAVGTVNRACLTSLQLIDAALMISHDCSCMGSLHLILACFSCFACAPTSHLNFGFCTALLLSALGKVHSDAEGGPLNLSQSLEFPHPFRAVHSDQICSHPRPLVPSIRRFNM